MDGAKVKAALETLAKEMPELLGKKTPGAGGATNPTKGSGAAQAETDDQRRARLRGGGVFNDWMNSGGVQYFPKPE